MVECTVEYANKYRGSPPKTGILLFLSETVIAGKYSVPTAKEVLNTPGATIFCDLGNGLMKDLFMILRGYGLNRLSPKDQRTINGLIGRKAEYIGDIIEAVLYWARREKEYELELQYFQEFALAVRDAGDPFWRHIPVIDPFHHDVAPLPKRARTVRGRVLPIVEGSGATATSDAQPSIGAELDQQTSDATPLAEERVGQPLLDRLIFEAESDAQSEAADSMLQQLHGFPALLEIRDTIVTKMAMEASSRASRWTPQEWSEWIGSVPFDRNTMNEAIRVWREDIFPLEMSQKTVEKMNNASSNAERRGIERSAFRAWQKEEYGHAALAKVLLKYPIASLHDLLEEWQAYTQTGEYQEQRSRHAPRGQRQQAACTPPAFEAASGSTGNGSPATNCSPPVVAPIRGRGSTHWNTLQELRQLRKAASKGKADPETIQWFRSGALDEKLAELTLEHGSGRYYDREGNAIDLRPHAFEDFLDQRPV